MLGGQNPRGVGAYSRGTGALPKLPETPLFEKIRTYRLHQLGTETYTVTLGELRQQLRTAELRPDIFLNLQQHLRTLLESEMSLQLEPVPRVRELVQGVMTAFAEKKMDQSEAARALATGIVCFFPRGVMEQLDVAHSVACELLLTKINLNTEMVQMAFGLGKAYPLLVGLAYFAPAFFNKDLEYLNSLYKKFHEGIWTGSMVATNNSQAHGKANLEKFETGADQYAQEWLARIAATTAQSLLSKLPFGWR